MSHLRLVGPWPKWGHGDLVNLKADARVGMSLDEMARRQYGNISAQDVDRALWAMLGRTIPEALDVLNGRR